MLEHLRALGDKSINPTDSAIMKMVKKGLIFRNGENIFFPFVEALIPTNSEPEPRPARPENIKIYPEISLEEEWQRQVQGFIELRFHTKLGLTEAEYVKRFPRFTSQSESFKGRFYTPVLVETKISPESQCKLAGIKYELDGFKKKDWNKKRKNYTTPKAPYATWLEDGRNNLNKKPENVRKYLKDDEIGGTELDGIALYISNPTIIDHHFLDLPGTSVRSNSAPYLSFWRGKTRLGYRRVGVASAELGSVVRGRQK